MGTRGVIARITGDGFEGRYHHWEATRLDWGRLCTTHTTDTSSGTCRRCWPT
jgi:hypothetical protein